MPDSLLTPSLSQAQANKQIHSPGSLFFVAFVGGPVGLIIFSALNSYKLRRPLDALVYLAAGTLFWGLLLALKLHPLPAPLLWLQQQLGPRFGFYLMRSYALLLWALFYFMHLNAHRCAALFAEKTATPWVSALVCTGLGWLALLVPGWLP